VGLALSCGLVDRILLIAQNIRILHLLLRICVEPGPQPHWQRSAVDFSFRSAAKAVGRGAIGVFLTGMGGDGTQGLLAVKEADALTFAQDEASCVAFGIPRVAIEMGAVDLLFERTPCSDPAERSSEQRMTF